MGCYEKSEADIYAGGIASDGSVKEPVRFREGDNLIEQVPDARPAHAKDADIQVDVLGRWDQVGSLCRSQAGWPFFR